ncbi:DUF998 domain-containing protein [Microbacterium hominis]|uniref:DUF998 domain-containing protein n=1 Tax=Microbacterium hominis TaxID=162426 RepID=A0A7D4UIK4_9MICO|nr:DUF998 domain-containing protein [Microbacterium hominis]QKJ19868.1 DUF998 domain-containing protein [Microbacterium hominis]
MSTAGVSTIDAAAPVPGRRAESEAVYAALTAGAIGAVFGLLLSLLTPDLRLFGDANPFGLWAASGAAVVAAAASTIEYWRARGRPGQEWRLALAPWKFTVNTISVVIVHTALAFVATFALYRVLALGFIGLPVITFWAIVLMAVTLGLTTWIVWLSVSALTTQRMTSLLLAFIAIGTLTAMVTTPDPAWWEVHFSHLGTFEDDLSSWVFNGTLIAAGLFVTTFAVYIANDMRALTEAGVLKNPRGMRVVPSLFVVMGIMLAGVGIFPFDVNLTLHNVSASGMAVMYLVLLATGPNFLKGMPRTYFVSAWAFLAALLSSVVLFIVQYFLLTAFEIIVFALVFGWVAVFIRFLGVAGRTD